MSRGKTKKLKGLLVEALVLLDEFNRENKELKEKNKLLNIDNKRISDWVRTDTNKKLSKKHVGIKERVLKIFNKEEKEA